MRRATASWRAETSTPTGRAPRWASHAETYPLPQPNSTATSPARPAGSTGNRDWGMRQIPQYGSAAAHRERAYRSNQADMCSSHCRRVTATCPPVLLGSGLQSIPGPFRNAHAFGDLVGGLVIARHRGCGGPGEVVVQHLSQRPGRVQANVLHGLVETGDRPAVHIRVRAIAAVEPHDRGLVAIGAGVILRAAEGLGPVCGEPFGVLRMEPVAERVADYLVGHHPAVPGFGEAVQALAATRGFVHALHSPTMNLNSNWMKGPAHRDLPAPVRRTCPPQEPVAEGQTATAR